MRFGAQPPQVLVPADKGLSKEWLANLTKRGTPTIYKGYALQHIGMPIGGIGCGQVYLGGDGRLWHWDIFNQLGEGDMGDIRNGLHYKEPMKPEQPFPMGFFIGMIEPDGNISFPIDATSFPKTEFIGKYPMAEVRYGQQRGIDVRLEAYSPFIPLNAADSGLPATVMTYHLTNRSKKSIEFEIVGWMENPCCLFSRKRRLVAFTGSSGRYEPFSYFEHEATEHLYNMPHRKDVFFEDFEKDSYEGWTVEGTAFGKGPIKIKDIPKYQGDVKGLEKQVANSHNTRQGEDVAAGDAHVGKLISPPFKVERDFITMLIGGGNHPGQICVNLIADGKIVRTETGRNSNEMSPVVWDVRDLKDRRVRIEIVDNVKGAWGNIGVDHIVFTDRPENALSPLSLEGDFGAIGMAMAGSGVKVEEQLESWSHLDPAFRERVGMNIDKDNKAMGKRLTLKPGESQTATFVISWYFPNVNRKSLSFLQKHETMKRHYAKRFHSASSVARYVIENFERLDGETRLWTKTWYDSTLPYWFLDRTMANTSSLSTSTCYRFDDGRFYGWEGTYCCAGTCTHVWHYAHAVGRLFPELERDTRERVDYGIGYHEDGHLGHRAEAWQDAATDGQCGTILRVYREHQMQSDAAWLKKMWPRVKRSIEFLISQDPNQDGVLEGPQFNTLDAIWYGKIAWISSLYVAALRAGEAMASEMQDAEFARQCAEIAAKGSEHIRKDLFNGEYFIQRSDPNFPKAINTNDGCHIDQVFGQSWAFQVGLPRVLAKAETKKALESLYRYNFAPDVGQYRSQSKIKGGRWYALATEPGLLMCTWPKGGAEKAPGKGNEDWAVGYFNECMTGFEHQVAGHMIWEGLVAIVTTPRNETHITKSNVATTTQELWRRMASI
jgi:non-lysosomal glucosylceramidase